MEALEEAAYGLGFESVASVPLVRSSYHADESAREVAERRRAELVAQLPPAPPGALALRAYPS